MTSGRKNLLPVNNKYILTLIAVLIIGSVVTGYLPDFFGSGDEIQNFNPQQRILYCSTKCLPVIDVEKTLRYDLNQNGTHEKIVLKNGILKVYSNGLLIWRSPQDWWVDLFFPGDSDNDGVPELNMIVWKQGSFGSVKPFWVEEKDKSIRCHLFVFRLQGIDVNPAWMSSNLPHPIYEAELNDTAGDGKNELVITAGSYKNSGKKETMIWKWDEWGFSKIQ